jgi:hypothetical protein
MLRQAARLEQVRVRLVADDDLVKAAVGQHVADFLIERRQLAGHSGGIAPVGLGLGGIGRRERLAEVLGNLRHQPRVEP